MVDPEKVMLMTRLAAYEKREEKKTLSVAGFFRVDFVAWELLKALVCGTLAFMIAIGIRIFADFDVLLQEVYEMDLVERGQEILKIYLIYMVVLLVGTYISAIIRFVAARRNLRAYYKGLKRLGEFYDGE